MAIMIISLNFQSVPGKMHVTCPMEQMEIGWHEITLGPMEECWEKVSEVNTWKNCNLLQENEENVPVGGEMQPPLSREQQGRELQEV